ncbi:hypothetical protein [Planctomycetes bacterium CA13]
MNETTQVAIGIDAYEQGESFAETLKQTDLSFGITKPGYWRGIQTPGALSLVVAEPLLRSLAIEAVNELIEVHFAFASEKHAQYGLIDVDQASRILAGIGFSSASVDELPLDRQMMHAQWIRNNFPKQKAMGVFWGNYFGGQLLDKLGGQESIQEFVRQKFADTENKPALLCNQIGPAVFVRLSRSPLDWYNSEQERFCIGRNAIQLHGFLLSHNVL